MIERIWIYHSSSRVECDIKKEPVQRQLGGYHPEERSSKLLWWRRRISEYQQDLVLGHTMSKGRIREAGVKGRPGSGLGVQVHGSAIELRYRIEGGASQGVFCSI